MDPPEGGPEPSTIWWKPSSAAVGGFEWAHPHRRQVLAVQRSRRCAATVDVVPSRSVGRQRGSADPVAAERRGYATEIRSQSVVIAMSYGNEQVLVTCDDRNIASAGVIEGCGASSNESSATTAGSAPPTDTSGGRSRAGSPPLR